VAVGRLLLTARSSPLIPVRQVANALNVTKDPGSTERTAGLEAIKVGLLPNPRGIARSAEDGYLPCVLKTVHAFRR
jgi:hypothetical protein